METYKAWVAVNVRANHKVNNFNGAAGLMGSYPSGILVGRDGVTLFDEDTNAFGKEWQVNQSEPMLFHKKEGVQHPTSCQMPTMDAAAGRNLRRRLGEALITKDDAHRACAHATAENHDACVFDVLATNDKDMAGAY